MKGRLSATAEVTPRKSAMAGNTGTAGAGGVGRPPREPLGRWRDPPERGTGKHGNRSSVARR